MTNPITHEDIFLEPLAVEEVPDSPPSPQARLNPTIDAELREQLVALCRPRASIHYDLLRSAWRLAELSRRYQGGYEQGLALPQSGIATATGCIALSCAAFEGCLNEEVLVASEIAEGRGEQGVARLLRTIMGLTPRNRLDAYAGYRGQVVPWGLDPFQSLTGLLSVRKHLLHAEPAYVDWDTGHWPGPAMRDLPQRLKSPYATTSSPTDLPFGWDTHVLSPAGAEWAIRTVVAVAKWIERLDPERDSAKPASAV